MQQVLLSFAEGLLCMAATGAPLVLVLVLLNRRRAPSPEQSGADGFRRVSFWKGVMLSSLLGALFCAAGAALTYSPSSVTGSTDSIGAGIVTFCGVAAFLIGVIVSWQWSRG
jgi:hypothetical protein